VDAESRGDVGVDVSDEEEEVTAEAEVIVDEEEMGVLLPTDAAVVEVADEDEAEEAGAPAPAGGNLSSASSLSFLVSLSNRSLRDETHSCPVNAK